MFESFASQLTRPVIQFMSRNRLPNRNNRLTVKGLRDAVEVKYDQWGIPHIQAQNRDDLFFAQGYIHTQDRLWQMELNRLVATGRLAAILGEPALSLDKMTRTLGFHLGFDEIWGRLGDETQATLNAYTRGVNRWLEENSTLPVEFSLLQHTPSPWTLQDIIAFGRLQAWSLSSGWAHQLTRTRLLQLLGDELFREIDPVYAPHNPSTLPRGLEENIDLPKTFLETSLKSTLSDLLMPGKGGSDGAGAGSNAWVIGSQRTRSGFPILANDTHLVVNSPGIWYYNHLKSNEETGYHATGVVIPGSPGVLIGHNASIAWGITVSFVDNQDLFLEKFETSKRERYSSPAGWVHVEQREELIDVKGAEPVSHIVKSTAHGPIIDDFLSDTLKDGVAEIPSNFGLALQSVALRVDNRAFSGLFHLARAHSFSEFKAAVDQIDAPSLNIVYADQEKNIGYALSGLVPIRAAGEGRTVSIGWHGEQEWVGHIPKSEMPSALNPESGYIVTCNHQIVDEQYPHFLSSCWMNGWRAARLVSLIESKGEDITLADCQAWQADLYSLPGMALVKHFESLETDDEDALLALTLLKTWDGYLTKDSVGGTVYKVLSYLLARHILEPSLDHPDLYNVLGSGALPILSPTSEFLGHWSTTVLRLLESRSSRWLPDGIGRHAFLIHLLGQTTKVCRSLFKTESDKWLWGDLHQISFPHAFTINPYLQPIFDQGPYRMGGDTDTVCQTAAYPTPIGEDQVNYRVSGYSPAFRQLVDLSNWGTGIAMTIPGQSGRVQDSHYGDLIEPWLNHKYYRQIWDELPENDWVQGRQQFLP